MNALEELRELVYETIDSALSLEAQGRATPEKIQALKESTVARLTKPRLSVNEVAAMLGVSVKTVRRLKSNGTLQAENDPGTKRVYLTHASVLKYRAQAS